MSSVQEQWGELISQFSPGKELSKALPAFEVRTAQKEMAQKVFEAFMRGCHAIIEAGTGTGKTLAYLIPSFFISRLFNSPVVVSTRTINLQEQLTNSDIPILKKVVGSGFSAKLVKGWGNYVCKRRFYYEKDSQDLLDREEFLFFSRLEEWFSNTAGGDISQFSGRVMDEVWDRVKCDFNACPMRKCPYYSSCFFFNTRKELEKANIIITNHALLFSHIGGGIGEEKNKSMILPDFHHLVLDEAHHVEDVASDFLGKDFSSHELYRILKTLYSKPTGKKDSGILARARDLKLPKPFAGQVKRTVDQQILPGVVVVRERGMEFFASVEESIPIDKKNDKVRVDLPWKNRLDERVNRSYEAFIRESGNLQKSLSELQELLYNHVGDNDEVMELSSLQSRIRSFRESVEEIWRMGEPDTIYSLEYNRKFAPPHMGMKTLPLDISHLLYTEVFSKMKSVVLTSATLSINKNFNYFLDRLGLNKFDKGMVLQKIYESPFDFKKQAILGIPTDIPTPDSPQFLKTCLPNIVKLIKIMKGRTFILFTSYKMLEEFAKMLDSALPSDYEIMIQGGTSRHKLLSNFKETDKAVLLGTDSFWEGVDVPGKALECVIIMKLPFKVPTDPVIQARTEYIRNKGGDPFNDYQVPQAVIKFKQGFGRLIRHRKDRGVIMVLDNRLLTKGYGRAFTNSLPPVKELKEPFKPILDHISKWLKEE